MIYRTDGGRGKVYESLEWKLYDREGQRVPLSLEEDLREYLKGHPDEDCFLIPGQFFNREVQGQTAASFDPRGEHIRCGLVRYDSASGKIVTRESMKVTYSENVRHDREAFALLQEATNRLEQVIGPTAAWVIVAWDRTKAGTYTLRIADWAGTATGSFTLEELREPINIQTLLYRRWGDVLQLRSDVQHLQVQQLVSGQMQAGG